jgi:alpha-tubulin suppressor-like RCC1 family protein
VNNQGDRTGAAPGTKAAAGRRVDAARRKRVVVTLTPLVVSVFGGCQLLGGFDEFGAASEPTGGAQGAGAGVVGEGGGGRGGADVGGGAGTNGGAVGQAGGASGLGGAGGEGGALPLAIASVRAGAGHTCALLNDGSLRCWGEAGPALGYGNVTENIGDNEAPASVGPVPVGSAVTNLGVGRSTCAILQGGRATCWGSQGAGNGLLGLDKVLQIAPGWGHTCALLEGGEVRCWGDNYYGHLGYGHADAVNDPALAGALSLGGKAVQVAVGTSHACALLEGGVVRCWGSNYYGQLGYPDGLDVGRDNVPSDKPPLSIGGKVTQIVTGGEHTCALLEGGTARCWGDNSSAQVGVAVSDVNPEPSSNPLLGLNGNVLSIAAGGSHTCALLEDGSVHCWGSSQFGQLGYGSTLPVFYASNAGPVDLGGKATQITASSAHTCALLEGGSLRCWGYNAFGQLGYGRSDDIGDDEAPASVEPVRVFLTPL